MALQQLTKYHGDLASGKVRSQTKVWTRSAEAVVIIRRPPYVEEARVLEDILIAIGRDVVHEDFVPLHEVHARERVVLGQRAAHPHDGRGPAYDFVSRGFGETVVVGEETRFLVGVFGERD